MTPSIPTSSGHRAAEQMTQLPLIAVALPIVVACFLLVAGRFLRHAVDVIVVATAGTVVGICGALLARTGPGRAITWVGDWHPSHGHSVGIVFVADPIGTGLAVLAGVLVTVALIYGWRYFDSVEAHFHALMLLFLTGMVGFCFTGDLFDMFVFLELMGAVAYALTGQKVDEPQSSSHPACVSGSTPGSSQTYRAMKRASLVIWKGCS
ncbi:MAG: hypothetical protein J2P17_07950 [Mycobacterium sp.]|nr:hypothetical protein [Mycobacterium sp.]